METWFWGLLVVLVIIVILIPILIIFVIVVRKEGERSPPSPSPNDLAVCIVPETPGAKALSMTSVEVEWHPVPDPNLYGYMIYVRSAPGVGTQNLVLNKQVNHTTLATNIIGLSPSSPYYISITSLAMSPDGMSRCESVASPHVIVYTDFNIEGPFTIASSSDKTKFINVTSNMGLAVSQPAESSASVWNITDTGNLTTILNQELIYLTRNQTTNVLSASSSKPPVNESRFFYNIQTQSWTSREDPTLSLDISSSNTLILSKNNASSQTQKWTNVPALLLFSTN